MVRPSGSGQRPDARPAAALVAPAPIHLVRGLLIGAVALALITAIKLYFSSTIGEPAPYRLYFVAVLAAAWYGGLPAGLVTTAGACALGLGFFATGASQELPLRQELVRLALFAFEGVAIAVVTSKLQRARRRSFAAAEQARAVAAKLDVVLHAVDDGITVQEPSGRLRYANETAARLAGFATPEELVSASREDLLGRFELLSEDGTPFPADELPGRVVLRGGQPEEKLVRFRVRGQAEDRFSLVRATAVRDDAGGVRLAVNVFTDVTERRKQDEAMRVSREWFSTALRSIGDAVITTDREGRVTFLNPIAVQLTGWSAEAAQGQPLHEVFVICNESTRAPAESPVDRVLRDGKVVGLANHTVLLSRTGSEVAIDDSAAPIRDDRGELVGVVLVFRDVSEKRREEQRRSFLVRASQELASSLDYETTLATVARLAVPAIADWAAVDMREGERTRRLGIAHVDPSKLELVAELERRYPPDPDAPSGTPHILRTGVAEMIREIPVSLIEQSARDEEHLRLVRQLALHSYIGAPIRRAGETVGVISFVTAESRRVYDQHDLELAQALADRAAVAIDNALLYREAQAARADAAVERDRLQALIMAAPTAIAVLRGPELVFDMMNEPYRRLAPGLVVGQLVREVAVDPRDLEMLERVLATGVPFSAVEQPIERPLPEGTQTTYNTYRVQPLRDAGGHVDRLVIFAQDVTDQVLARQRIEAARAEAELANRSKDDFLAMLGHELRNPLAPIVTALQLMNLKGDEVLMRERQVIERQVKHVVRLVDDLLDVSRISRGIVELERERLEVTQVIADAIEMVSPWLEQGQHVLETMVPRSGLVVHVDRLRMAQVLANLLTNAAKYTEPGGRIEVRAAREGDRIVIRVRDTGVGISPDMLPRVFELFAQERQTIDRSRGGLGIGLTIVKNLVTLHGGEVSAHSDGPGKGSELVVTLEPAPAEAGLGATAAPPAPLEGAGTDPHRRVLIVDDNEDAAEMLSMVLTARGYLTRVAHDGPSALLAAAEFRPQAALLDIGLPVMDGFELARRLRAVPELDGLRLIAVTGYGQDTDRDRSRAAGFDHHLVKPIDVKSVLTLLDARPA